VTRRVGPSVRSSSGRAGRSRLQRWRRQRAAAVRAGVPPHPADRAPRWNRPPGSPLRIGMTDPAPTRPLTFAASKRSRTLRDHCSTASTQTPGTMGESDPTPSPANPSLEVVLGRDRASRWPGHGRTSFPGKDPASRRHGRHGARHRSRTTDWDRL